jgi:ADP-ribose pyrophosphatase YjhB (NUDIX family)
MLRTGGTGLPRRGPNPGESYAAAASRELAEETGWTDVALLGEIHRHMRTMEHGGQIARQHEGLFLARTVRACRELGGRRRDARLWDEWEDGGAATSGVRAVLQEILTGLNLLGARHRACEADMVDEFTTSRI